MQKAKCACTIKGCTRISKLLRDIAEDNRLKIICLLGKNELCACEIMDNLNLPHNLISHHLKVLVGSGIISQRKEGRFRFYKINRKVFIAFKREFDSLTGGQNGTPRERNS